MNTFLLTWNPERFHWDGLAEAARELRRQGFLDTNWTCGRRKHMDPGDRVFLIRQGVEPRGIVASGHALTSPVSREIDFDEKRLGAMTNYIDVRFDALLDPAIDGVLPRGALNQGPLADVNWGAQSGGIAVGAEAAELLEELWAEHLAGMGLVPPPVIAEEVAAPARYVEGATTRIAVNAYERNPAAREACIQRHGVMCVVCGFDFEALYGDLGKGFIHVHHLVPLADVGRAYVVDPDADLRPVCPNCHAMLHRHSSVLSIDELKALLTRGES